MNKQRLEEMKKELAIKAEKAKAEKAATPKSGVRSINLERLPELQEGLHEVVFEDITLIQTKVSDIFSLTVVKDGKRYETKATRQINAADQSKFIKNMGNLLYQLELEPLETCDLKFQVLSEEDKAKLGVQQDDLDRIKNCAGKGMEIVVLVNKVFVEMSAKTYYNAVFDMLQIREAHEAEIQAELQNL